MTAVFCASLITLAVAAVLPLLGVRLALVTASAGSTLLAAVGFAGAAGWAHPAVHLGSWLGFGPAVLACDRMSGIFLALAGAAGAAASLGLVERPPRRLTAALHALILLSVAAVVGADQAYVFLLAWETLTLSLYLLAGTSRERPSALAAAYFSSGFNKLGGASLLAAFALLYGRTGSFEFSVWAHAAPGLGASRSVVFVLLLIGFGSKIGLVPLQGALPALYAAVPAGTAATASITLNAGFYGLWRLVFETLGPGPAWWGELLIVIGGLGALTGIVYAVAEDEIRRFLGFSSVEHGGIVLIGFGVALLGQAVGKPELAAVGLLAGMLHLVMHGVAKTVAFMGAARIRDATGAEEMRLLGGLSRRMPGTAVCFGLAVLTLAAMPPFAGFVSEWFTFEALLQGFRLGSATAQLVMALGAAMLALTTGVGLLAFARLFGGVFLGRPRTALTVVRESRRPVAFATLATLLLVLGAVAPWEIRWIGRGLSTVLGFDLARTTIRFPLVLGPVYRNFSVLAPTWLAIGIATFAVTAAVLVRVFLRPAVRRAPVWLSGTAVEVAAVQYTPEAYANPIRVVLARWYGFQRYVDTGEQELILTTRVVPVFEEYIYGRVVHVALWLSSGARRLQSGRLSAYLLYVLVVLLVVLALIPALKN